MKKVALLVCLLIPILGFSQTHYPKSILINGDTLVAITPNQLIKINLLTLDYKECEELSSLKDSIMLMQNKQIELYKADNQTFTEVQLIKDSIITEVNIQSQILNDELVVERKKVKRLKITKKVFTFVGTALGAGIGFFVGKGI